MNQNSITLDERSPATRKRMDLAFLGLIGLQILFGLPYWLNLAVPYHDTLQVFEWFAFFYNEVFWHNALPQWIPFGFYGIQSDYFPTHLGPAHFLVGLAGYLLRAENMYVLFKISMLLEQLALLYGIYLLATELFRHKSTVFFVCITVIGSNFLLYQLAFNFRAFYLLPLIIFLLLRFLASRRLVYLSMVFVVFFMLIPGTGYLLSANMLIVLLMAAILVIGNYNGCLKHWRDIFKLSRRDILWNTLLFLVLILLLGSYAYLLHSSLVDTRLLAEGRDPQSGVTDLHTFLTYAPDIGLAKFVRLINPIPNILTDIDLSLYAGVFALPLFIYGLIYRRNLVQVACLVVVVVLGAASLGKITPVAELLYNYFPLMKYYRHIGYIVYSYHIFVPILAGYGLDCAWDRFASWKDGQKSTIRRVPGFPYSLLFLLAGMWGCAVYGGYNYAHSISHYCAEIKGITPSADFAGPITAVSIAVLLLILMLFPFAFRKRDDDATMAVRIRLMVIGLATFLCLDMFAFQISQTLVLYKGSTLVRKLFGSDGIRVARYVFQKQRTFLPPSGRASLATFLPSDGANYTIACDLLQWDPCIPLHKIEMISSHIATFIEVKGGVIGIEKGENIASETRNCLGWETDKLKVLTKVRLVSNPSDALAMIRIAQDISLVPVIIGEQQVQGEKNDSSSALFGHPSIEVLDYWANEIKMKVLAPQDRPAWLYYAEAWHPDWRAYVNGRPVPVLRANYAVKAVKLDRGPNEVYMVFDNIYRRWASYTLVLMGAGFALAMLLGLGWIIMTPPARDGQRT